MRWPCDTCKAAGVFLLLLYLVSGIYVIVSLDMFLKLSPIWVGP